MICLFSKHYNLIRTSCRKKMLAKGDKNDSRTKLSMEEVKVRCEVFEVKMTIQP